MTPRCPERTRWTREQIRAARLAPLVPLLQKRGLQLAEREAGNFTLPAYSRLRLRLNSIEEIERWVLTWGIHATVVRPQALADRLRRIGQDFVARYTPPAET